MKSTHLMGLTFVMLVSSPVFAKSPLTFFVDGQRKLELEVLSPEIKLDQSMIKASHAQKKLVLQQSIDSKQVASIISFLNRNKHLVVKGDEKELGKLYFSPDFGENSAGKIFFSNGTGAVRLQQSFYYRDEHNKTIHIPFEGAEVVVMIKENDQKAGEVGDITSINSSLIDSKSYEDDIAHLKGLNNGKFESLADLNMEKRDEFVDILLREDNSFDVWKEMALALYPNLKFKDRTHFLTVAKADKDIVQKVMLSQKAKSKLVFSSIDGQKSFDLVYSLKAPFGLPLNLKVNADANAQKVFQKVSNLGKHATVNIWRSSLFKMKKSKKRSGESSVAKNMKVKGGLFRQKDYDIALVNLSKILEEYKSNFHWNSFDNKGSALDATVRFKGSKLLGTDFMRQNAAWLGAPYNQFLFGRGGDELNNFLEAFDVIGHEYCHAVVSHTCNLDDGNEPGALNEHVCDILGVGVESTITKKPYDFKIGELVVQKGDKALRDFLNPADSSSPQASSMKDVEAQFGQHCISSQYNDSCGVHFSNGVPNNAIGRSIKAIGWKRMKNVIFDTVTKRLRSSSNFLDYKRQIVASCMDQADIEASDCKKIENYFAEVGVK